MLFKIFLFFIIFLCETIKAEIEVFKQDLGDNMEIAISKTEYKSVKLKCESNSMNINLQTDADFSGVIYTRGNFHQKAAPCFLDPGMVTGQRFFQLKIPLDACNTKKEGDIYSNVVILQHDKELIMPGDAAFKLQCDFGTPRDITVQANLKRISPTDADPSDRNKGNAGRFIENASNIVEITPVDFSGSSSSANIEL